MKKKLLIGTHNPAKFNEISSFLQDMPLQLLSLTDVGISEDAVEDGKTYQENSQKKALFYAKKSGLPTIADDGGLEIVALGGKPGVKSKRWLGANTTEEMLVEHMKQVAKELPEDNREAYFKTVISLALPDGKVWSVPGEIKGHIAKQPFVKLLKGYPYRSFFYLPKLHKYYHESELTPEEQKIYNHRVKAITQIKPLLQEFVIS